MDKFTEAYKKVIKEDAIREVSEKEFPEQLTKNIQELVKIKEKVDKRAQEEEQLDKKLRDIGKTIDKFEASFAKKGMTIPSKYKKLVWDTLEDLH